MNAPLSRYLTRFAADAIVAAPLPPEAMEPVVTMTVAELDARLAEVVAATQAEAEAMHLAAQAEMEQAHAAALAEAVATARAAWCADTAQDVAGMVERSLATLQSEIAEATAKALRPLLADAARERALAALTAVVARLVADPLQPAIAVRTPADVVAALRLRGLPDGVALVAAETSEAVVICGATRIETRLAAALADINGLEA
jgi:hypothetical protein